MYLDGSKQVGFLLAEVEETSDGDPIRQEIDEGDVIDQVVRLPDAQDYDGGGALRENGAALKGRITEAGRRYEAFLRSTHADEQGRDGGAVLQVDHSQEVRQVTLSGPREAQSADRRRDECKRDVDADHQSKVWTFSFTVLYFTTFTTFV